MAEAIVLVLMAFASFGTLAVVAPGRAFQLATALDARPAAPAPIGPGAYRGAGGVLVGIGLGTGAAVAGFWGVVYVAAVVVITLALHRDRVARSARSFTTGRH